MGATFENLYLRTRQSDTLKHALEEMMKKRGYTRISNEDAADFSISIHVPASGAWCFVSSDNETPGFLKRLCKPLAGLFETEALFAACDGSDLLKASLFAPSGESASLNIDVTHPAAPPRKEEAAIWDRIVSDPAAFRQAAAAEYTFAEEFLFAIAPLIDLPTENMMFWEADDEATTILCFAKKDAAHTTEKSVSALIGAGLRSLGFEKHKAAYYKPIDGEFGLAVKLQKDRNATLWSETADGMTIGYGTHKNAYDIRVEITNRTAFLNDWFLGIEMRFIAKLQQLDLISDLRRTPEEVSELLLRALREYAYDPLFQNESAERSVFDVMCGWEIRAFGHVRHNDYTKALAAYREEKYENALFCLKWIFNQNLVSGVEDMTDEKASALTDDKIEFLRESERYDRLKNCFALYDLIKQHI